MATRFANTKQSTIQGHKAEILEKEAYNEIFDEQGAYIGYPVYRLIVDWEKLGDPPAWCEATTDYIESSSLCETCSKLDFKGVFKEIDRAKLDPEERPKSSPDTIALGTLDEIATKGDCSFCQLLLMIAHYLYPEGVPVDSVCTVGREDRSFDTHAWFSIKCPTEIAPNGTAHESKRRQLALWRDYPWPSGKAPKNPVAGGPPANEFMLLSMVGKLVTGCLHYHPKCRQQGRLALKMTTQMFVIDVQDLMIVPAPENCSYVALSYVWGSHTASKYHINPIKASTAMVIPLPENVPVTIIHALNVTKQLSFQYLWVDQLCIPRDVSASQIAEMDKIYRNATLTLAACVHDAESGLPGTGAMNRKRRAPPILRIHGLNIGLKQPPNIYRALENTTWPTRGWTFQEKALSSRILYVTEEDIFYTCLEGEISEHACHAKDVIDYTRDTFFNMGGVLATTHGRVPFQIFGDCVYQYTSRKLTYESDILNGFAGLIAFLSERFEWEFCWGLPSEYFALALLWVAHSGTARRREARDRRDRRFPSWSWAGWLAAVSYQGVRPKALEKAEGLFHDFVDPSWELEMLERASESGVLVLDADCIDITEGNHNIFHSPGASRESRQKDDPKVWIGCVFVAIALLAEPEPLVQGLVISNPSSDSDSSKAERVEVTAVKPEIWLSMSRERRTIELA